MSGSIPESEAKGSSKQWDAIWKQYDADEDEMRKAFVRGKTLTVNQFWQRCYFEDLLHCTRPKQEWKFQELASGRGTTSLYLSDQGMHDVTLVDLSETALRRAEKNFISEGQPKPATIVGNAEETGLPGNNYDCIYNIGVLEHFEDPSRILGEALRLLKPGGKLFMPIVPEMPFFSFAPLPSRFRPDFDP